MRYTFENEGRPVPIGRYVVRETVREKIVVVVEQGTFHGEDDRKISIEFWRSINGNLECVFIWTPEHDEILFALACILNTEATTRAICPDTGRKLKGADMTMERLNEILAIGVFQ